MSSTANEKAGAAYTIRANSRFILLFVFIVSFLAFHSSLSKKHTKKEISQIEAEKNKYFAQTKKLEAEKNALKSERDGMEKHIKIMQEEIAKLKTEYAAVKADYAKKISEDLASTHEEFERHSNEMHKLRGSHANNSDKPEEAAPVATAEEGQAENDKTVEAAPAAADDATATEKEGKPEETEPATVAEEGQAVNAEG